MKIKGISLWEPWASLMRCGAKTIETRGWYTSYRGPLLICGAKRWTREQFEIFYGPAAELLRPSLGPLLVEKLMLGKAACLVELIDCMRTDDLFPSPKERECGNYAAGRFGWITTNLRTFDPFPVRGAQGLFEVELPAELEEKLATERENKHGNT